MHIFPSSCEGSAKVTYDAAACGIPQITTRVEAGDVVIDGVNFGLVVPCGDVDALCAAIERLYAAPALRSAMSRAARARVVENFTWDHYRARLLEAYDVAGRRCTGGSAEQNPTLRARAGAGRDLRRRQLCKQFAIEANAGEEVFQREVLVRRMRAAIRAKPGGRAKASPRPGRA